MSKAWQGYRKAQSSKLKAIILNLAEDTVLPKKYANHKLRGAYKDCWECHIEPDWLLIYKKTSSTLLVCRTGTHSDLF